MNSSRHQIVVRVCRALTALSLCSCMNLFSPATVRADQHKNGLIYVRVWKGPCCGDQGADLAVAPDGAVFIAGRRGGLDIDGDGSVDLQTFGTPDPLIFKTYDDRRNEWFQGPGGPKRDAAYGVAYDNQGGVYAVGTFTDKMKVGEKEIVSAGGVDGFLIRYGKDGSVLWAKAIGSTSTDDLADVAVDSDGNVIIIGTIRGPVDLNSNGKVDVGVSGPSSLFVASYSADGVLRWAHSSAGSAMTHGRSLAVGPRGELYIAGNYLLGELDLDADGKTDALRAEPPQSGKVDETVDMNAFVARIESGVKLRWIRLIAGPGVQAVGPMQTSETGDLFVVGGYTASADLDADGSLDLDYLKTSEESADSQADGNSFLLKLQPDGKRVWVEKYRAMARHMALQGEQIVISGVYSGPLDIDGDGKLERAADSDTRLEGFAALLDSRGKQRKTYTIVGGDSDIANAAGFSPDGRIIYVTGYTKLGADFDGDNKIESSTACHQIGDIYLAAYRAD